MSNTAPFLLPKVDSLTQNINTYNLDFSKINTFNDKIVICSICEHCVKVEQLPYCSTQDLPLSVSAEKENCPIGKW
jgi:hypothetical protein